MTDRIRLFVGCPANNEDLESQAVLEYSLRSRSSLPIDLTWMMLSRDKNSFWYSREKEGWQTNGWATPFTNLRWGIPAFCNFEGKAIYTDSDVIGRADLAELWNQPIPEGKVALMKGNLTAVMLMDCSAFKTVLPPINLLRSHSMFFRDVRHLLDGKISPFEGDWNCRDGEQFDSAYDPRIKLLHYTNIPTQPNHKHARARLKKRGHRHWFVGPDEPHRLPDMQKLFDEELTAAINNGYLPSSYVQKEPFGVYGRGKSDKHIERRPKVA